MFSKRARANVDGGYGQSFALPRTLEDQGEVFVADIHSDRHIYAHDPELYLPAQKPGLGRPRVVYQSDAHSIEVRKWVKRQPASAWRKKTLRGTTKGDLVIEVLHRRVWLWDKNSHTARCWHLIVRREVNNPFFNLTK